MSGDDPLAGSEMPFFVVTYMVTRGEISLSGVLFVRVLHRNIQSVAGIQIPFPVCLVHGRGE